MIAAAPCPPDCEDGSDCPACGERVCREHAADLAEVTETGWPLLLTHSECEEG